MRACIVCHIGIVAVFHPPVEEINELKAELLVDVLLRHLGVHLRANHESEEEFVHQLRTNGQERPKNATVRTRDGAQRSRA